MERHKIYIIIKNQFNTSKKTTTEPYSLSCTSYTYLTESLEQ